MESWRAFGRAARWLGPAKNPAGAVYGTIAVGAVLAAEHTRNETFRATLEATVITLTLYWLAHAYASVVGHRFDRDDAGSLTARDWWRALSHEWAIVKGATPPIVVLLVLAIAGVSLRTAVTAAVWTSATCVVAFEVVAAARTGVSPPRRAFEVLVGVLLGSSVLLLRIILH